LKFLFNRDRNIYDDSNEIRSRISTKSNEQQSIKINKDSTSKNVNVNDKLQVATKSKYSIIIFSQLYIFSFYLGGGRFTYVGITIIVAVIVFVLYFLV
jgi:hypothetical protein